MVIRLDKKEVDGWEERQSVEKGREVCCYIKLTGDLKWIEEKT